MIFLMWRKKVKLINWSLIMNWILTMSNIHTVIQPHQIFLPWKYLFFNKELKMSIYRRRIFLLFLIIFNSLMKKFKLLNGEVIFFFKYKVFIPIIGRETSSSWSRSFSALKRKRNFSYFFLILRHSPSFFIKEVLYVSLAGKAWNKSRLPAVNSTWRSFFSKVWGFFKNKVIMY